MDIPASQDPMDSEAARGKLAPEAIPESLEKTVLLGLWVRRGSQALEERGAFGAPMARADPTERMVMLEPKD